MRISFGYCSTLNDARAFIKFLNECFLNDSSEVANITEDDPVINDIINTKRVEYSIRDRPFNDKELSNEEAVPTVVTDYSSAPRALNHGSSIDVNSRGKYAIVILCFWFLGITQSVCFIEIDDTIQYNNFQQ